MLVRDAGFDGVAIRLETVGIDIASETDSEVVLRVAAGEVWDDVVRFACEQNWWGIENLSHIPGFVGAIPVQNVGAYGQEASQVITQVEVYDRSTKQIQTLSNEQCAFGYRSSLFNQAQKHRYVILSVDFKLSKISQPNLSYGDVSKQFAGQQEVSIQDIRDVIVQIRDQKFPFPSSPEHGNSGSFFRGPILNEQQFQDLLSTIENKFNAAAKQKVESMQDKLKVAQGYKTPAAFLIELCDLKNEQHGGAKINFPQPAVIVNYTGQATSSDVLELYAKVSDQVEQQTGVKLGIEPELVGFSESELRQFNIV